MNLRRTSARSRKSGCRSLRRCAGRASVAWFLVAAPCVTADPTTPSTTDDEKAAATEPQVDRRESGDAGEPETFSERIVVTATRTERPVERLPLSASVVSQEALDVAAHTSVDGVLRAVAGVNLPNGVSETQYPALNTVSMRGLGEGRALVLVDGVPLNDAMFGHVDWTRLPLRSLERIEVVRGGSAALFGSSAMGGTISLFSRSPVDGELAADLSVGEQQTRRGSLSYARGLGAGAIFGVELGAADSDGYQRVPAELRRPIDERSPWKSRHASARTELALRPGVSGFVRAGFDAYDLGLGNAISRIENDATDVAAGLRMDAVGGGRLSATAFYRDQRFDVANARVAADGGSVSPGNFVATPSHLAGGSLQWERSIGGAGRQLLLGADLRRMSADSHRLNFDAAGAVGSTQDSGGRQESAGLFAQISWQPTGRFELLASLRVDEWRNHDGYNVLSNGADERYPAKRVAEVSPRLAARWDLGGDLALRGAAYRAFGAPRLDQLYRSSSFRGQDNLPNPALEPETLVGGEVGLDLAVERLRGQLNVFVNRVENVVADVVIYTTPATGQQPRNIGRARSRGVELMAEAYLAERWRAELSYVYTDATTRESPQDRALEGNQTPLVPRHAAAVGLLFRARRGAEATARVTYVGELFQDAENRLRYDRHALVDLFASLPLGAMLKAYVAVTNLFDETYLDGVGIVTRVGAPRQARMGLRVATGGRGATASGADG